MQIKVSIILYNTSLKESECVQSLINLESELNDINVNIYLNGICKQDCQRAIAQFNIIDNSGENLFLLKNYQDCIKRCLENNNEWIVFFDQDTQVTKEYIAELHKLSGKESDVVAAYPKLRVDGKIVSPRSLFHGSLFPSKVLKPNIYSGVDYLGLNSGSAYRVSYFESIMEIDEVFRLDFIDYVFSYHVYRSEKSFKVMNVVLEHDMAVLKNTTLDVSRSESILAAENAYYKEYRGLFATVLYKLKLLYKLFRSLISKNYIHNKSTLTKYLMK